VNPIAPIANRILGGSDLILVDVGAATGLPLHLSPLEDIAQVCYFEPDMVAAEALRRRNAERGFARSRVFTDALSNRTGTQTLYVTNVPTGSSLLKPGGAFMADMDDPAYFFPLKEVAVQTSAMSEVLAREGIARADAVKIDVQGAEFWVVQGMGPLLQKTLCVEMEVGFPGCYLEQPGFGDIDPLMTTAGFMLFDLKVANLHRKKEGRADYYPTRVFGVPYRSTSLTRRIGEADMVYFRRPDLLIGDADMNAIRRAMTLHCTYGFFVEALDLNDRALAAGLQDAAQHRTLTAAVMDWQGRTSDVLLDWVPFARMLEKALQLWRRIQGKFFGRYFTPWSN